MDFNFNFKGLSESSLNPILNKLTLLEEQMATLQEIIEATRAEQSLITGALASISALVVEVRQLLAANDVAGADQLLADIQANSAALVQAGIENTEVAAMVDAVNGDPVV